MDGELFEAWNGRFGEDCPEQPPSSSAIGCQHESMDVRDPVCGTRVPGRHGPVLAFRGTSFRFCSETCRRIFLMDPVRFIK